MRSQRLIAARGVVLGATALLIAAGMSAVPMTVPKAMAADCADAEVVFARGTDEPPGLGRVGDALVDSLRKQAPTLKIGTYAVDYKASKSQLHDGDGAKDAIAHIKSMASTCPDTKIVLGGYSQGADVVNIVAGNPIVGIAWGDALPASFADNVAAIATFGNVANRVGTKLPSESAMFAGRGIDLCNPMDPICHAGPGNEWSGHTEGYVPVYTTQAATFVASKLLAGTGQEVPGFGPPQSYGPPAYGPTPTYDPSTSTHGPLPGPAPSTPGDGGPTPVPVPSNPTSPDIGYL